MKNEVVRDTKIFRIGAAALLVLLAVSTIMNGTSEWSGAAGTATIMLALAIAYSAGAVHE